MSETPSKREGYVNLDLADMSETQEMVVNMFIHEGELRAQDSIWALLIKKMPPLMSDDDFDRGFEAGYDHAMSVINEYIHGPAEPEEVVELEPELDFDVTDVDDPE